MPHITLDTDLPGITGGFAFRPETAQPMRELAHILLHTSGQDSDLSSRDRELIATFVSSLNTCRFCQMSHGAAAAYLAGDDPALIDSICQDFRSANVPDELKALLAIAEAVQKGGKNVTSELVAEARKLGASDLQIHDTVLIAAAFCMYNRYVDGLGTWEPTEPSMYREMGKRMAEHGYTGERKPR